MQGGAVREGEDEEEGPRELPHLRAPLLLIRGDWRKPTSHPHPCPTPIQGDQGPWDNRKGWSLRMGARVWEAAVGSSKRQRGHLRLTRGWGAGGGGKIWDGGTGVRGLRVYFRVEGC